MGRQDFPDDFAVARQLNRERVVLFGWSRAILMQLAHPLVAAGVAQHSTFRSGMFTAGFRLHHTVRAMLALTFGTESDRLDALDGIRTIHRRVNGTLTTGVGRFPAGTPYSAEDPSLVVWVHTTLLDSIPLVYDTLVGPLTPAQRDAYCVESAGVAIALGARDADVPRDQASVQRHIERTLASRSVAVGPDARALADAVLQPPLRLLTGPASAINRLITIGLLPEAFREQYGFTWTAQDARRFARACRWIRHARALAPDRIALWRDARRTRP